MTSKFKRNDLPKKRKRNLNNNKVKQISGNGGNGGNGNGKLTPQQDKFVDEYLKDLNATQAAIRAGYSKKHPDVAGSQLLSILKIQQAVQKRRDKLKASAEIDQEWVLKRYKMLTDYSVGDFFNDDGTMKPLSQIPKDKLYAVCGFKADTKQIDLGGDSQQVIETLIREFKLPDKKGVLDSIGKHLGMFEKDNEQRGGNITIEQMNIQVNLVE